MNNKLLPFILLVALAGSSIVYAANDDHDHNEGSNHREDTGDMSIDFVLEPETTDEHGDHDDHGSEESGHGGHDEHEEEGGVELSPAQLSAAGIVVEALKTQTVSSIISAPGEVFFNQYKSKKITPRISAQIIKRLKHLGQVVNKGDALVSLSSVEMAEAQGQLIVSDREWQRVKKLGKKVVSERRYIEAQISRQQAEAKVLAFGMTKRQVKALLNNKSISSAVGQFSLLATQHGTITNDNFVEGEIVQPGHVLFEISDESSIWVEARLRPNVAFDIKPGAAARILVNQQQYSAKVTQIHHMLDESTRTIAVRMEVKNNNDNLHPGLFVEVQIESTNTQQALALPENAILRNPDGDWVVFVEEQPGHFKAQEIEIAGNSGELVIIKGIEAGTRVVSKGAFFVQSEIAKSGFSVHNH